MAEQGSILAQIIQFPMLASDMVDRWAKRKSIQNGSYLSHLGDSSFGGSMSGYRGAPGVYGGDRFRKNHDSTRQVDNQSSNDSSNQGKYSNSHSSIGGDSQSGQMTKSQMKDAIKNHKGGVSSQNIGENEGQKSNSLSNAFNDGNAMSKEDVMNGINQSNHNVDTKDLNSDDVKALSEGYSGIVNNTKINGDVSSDELKEGSSSSAQSNGKVYNSDGQEVLTGHQYLEENENNELNPTPIQGEAIDQSELDRQRQLSLNDKEIAELREAQNEDEFANRLLYDTDDGFDIGLRNLDLTPEEYEVLRDNEFAIQHGEGEDKTWELNYEDMRNAYKDKPMNFEEARENKEYNEYMETLDLADALKNVGSVENLTDEQKERWKENELYKKASNESLDVSDIDRHIYGMRESDAFATAYKMHRAEVAQAVATNGAKAMYNSRVQQIDDAQMNHLRNVATDFAKQKQRDDIARKKQLTKEEYKQRVEDRKRWRSKVYQNAKVYSSRMANPVAQTAKIATAKMIRASISGGKSNGSILGNKLTNRLDNYIANPYQNAGKPSKVKQVAKKATDVVAKPMVKGARRAEQHIVREINESREAYNKRLAKRATSDNERQARMMKSYLSTSRDQRREDRLERKAEQYAEKQAHREFERRPVANRNRFERFQNEEMTNLTNSEVRKQIMSRTNQDRRTPVKRDVDRKSK